jgi:serine/threonine protein kinase
LGSGSFSKTKLALDTVTGKHVAIKILKQDLSQAALKTIFTEINALKVLPEHPHIINLIDYGQQEYKKLKGNKLVNFIAVELAGGGELFNIIT